VLLIAAIACSRISSAQGWSGGIISDEHLFIGSMVGQLLSLDIDTGKHTWEPILLRVDKDQEELRAVYGTPAVYKNIAIVASYDGKIHAFSTEHGTLLESEPVAEQFIGGALISNGRLYVGSGSGTLYAFDVSIKTGTVSLEKSWQFNAGSSIWSTPAINGDILVFTSLDHYVYAIDARDGEEIWRFETGAAIAATPVIADNSVFVGSFDSNFYSIELSSGREKWRFEGASNWYWAKPVLSRDFVYAASLDGKLYALKSDSGEKRWETSTDSPIVGSPAIVSDMIVFGSRSGQINVVELSSGVILGTCDVDERIETPILAYGDTVYFGARDHSIRALVIKQNGNPDEKWDAPYFSDKAKDDENPNPSDWSPAC